MKEMDPVEIIVEKEEYLNDGVHKGMQGWICSEQRTPGVWLVNFPQCGGKDDIAEISVKEEDLRRIPIMNAKINEEIAEKYNQK